MSVSPHNQVGSSHRIRGLPSLPPDPHPHPSTAAPTGRNSRYKFYSPHQTPSFRNPNCLPSPQLVRRGLLTPNRPQPLPASAARPHYHSYGGLSSDQPAPILFHPLLLAPVAFVAIGFTRLHHTTRSRPHPPKTARFLHTWYDGVPTGWGEPIAAIATCKSSNGWEMMWSHGRGGMRYWNTDILSLRWRQRVDQTLQHGSNNINKYCGYYPSFVITLLVVSPHQTIYTNSGIFNMWMKSHNSFLYIFPNL